MWWSKSHERPKRAKVIILTTKEGAKGLLVSVKTGIGYDTIELDMWPLAFLEVKPVAIYRKLTDVYT
jgi:hypothetical protein